MAKSATVKIRLVSTADTGFFYVTKKNPVSAVETRRILTVADLAIGQSLLSAS